MIPNYLCCICSCEQKQDLCLVIQKALSIVSILFRILMAYLYTKYTPNPNHNRYIYFLFRYEQTLKSNLDLTQVRRIYPAALTNYPCCPSVTRDCRMLTTGDIVGRAEQQITSRVILRETGRCKRGRSLYEPVVVTDLSIGCHCAVPYVEPDNVPEEDRLLKVEPESTLNTTSDQ